MLKFGAGRCFPGAKAFSTKFSPLSLFKSGQLGAWYDPSSFTGLYQDSTGTSPATAVGQPDGLMLDKSGRANHLSQATASARPLISARVNLLTKTEQFDDGGWSKTNGSITANSVNSPLGTLTADTFTAGTAGVQNTCIQIPAGTAGLATTLSCYVKAGTASWVAIGSNNTAADFAYFNVSSGALGSRTGFVTSSSITSVGSGWYLCTATLALAATQGRSIQIAAGDGTYTANAVGDSVYLWGASCVLGTAAGNYQRVNTATDYDTVGFPQFLTFDGLDDGLSTGPITLGADMDCFIAIRRNSSPIGMLCSDSNSSNFFGCYENGSPSLATNLSGAPAYLVNGVAVPGGTTVSRGQLSTAINVGNWSIVEVQDLALSAYAALYVMRWVGGNSYYVNGDFGGMILCPAGDAATRQKNRQYLGNKVGLTLP